MRKHLTQQVVRLEDRVDALQDRIHPSSGRLLASKAVRKSFVVYDERAIHRPTDDASVLVVCSSLKEAWSFLREDFGNGAIYSYDLVYAPDLKADEGINETMEGWRSEGKEWHA